MSTLHQPTRRQFLALAFSAVLAIPSMADVDLVTIPRREGTQLTIYNSEDITIRRSGGRKLRIATERFCKLVLVKKRRECGDTNAAISDYEGQMLGRGTGLRQQVTPYLDVDPSHPGKLKVICNDLNPPAHDDDAVPTRQALREALGNIIRFRKDYL